MQADILQLSACDPPASAVTPMPPASLLFPGMLAARLGMLRREIMKWTDKRVGRMNELINGIQVRQPCA